MATETSTASEFNSDYEGFCEKVLYKKRQKAHPAKIK